MPQLVCAANVFEDVSVANKEELFGFLSQKAQEAGIASDANAVLEALKAREDQGTTGMLGGFAIPHATTPAVTRTSVIVVRLAEGIEWSSMDNEPITCAIALLVSANEEGTTHLRLLSKVAVSLMEDGFRESLAGAGSAQDVAQLLSERLAE